MFAPFPRLPARVASGITAKQAAAIRKTINQAMSTDPSAAPESHGIQTLESPHSFPGTVSRLISAIESHSIKIFATIDQQAEAAAVGIAMPPVTLILFGSPKAGTPLMLAQPTAALDLPLKAVVWASDKGEVFVTFNTAGYLIARHHLPAALAANIAPAEKLLSAALL
jgi:uncharacterized protein (DUF302 family)